MAGTTRSARLSYRLYGLSMESDVELPDQLPAEDPRPDLIFTTSCPPPFKLPDDAVAVYRSEECSESGEPDFTFYRDATFDVLRIRGQADFYLTDRTIHCVGPRAFTASAVMILYLLGPVFALWLETRGRAVLHATAVVHRDSAVAFLAASGTGKSSLAGAFLRDGASMLSDDLVALERRGADWLAVPAFPQLRMWPDEARYFVGERPGLAPVHPAFQKLRVPIGPEGWASYCSQPTRLAAIYVLERRPADEAGAIEIRRMARVEALFALIGHSFAARAVESLGLQGKRMADFCALLDHVPVMSLSYPSGREHLSTVRRAVADDIAGGCGRCA